ncbi:uncharacterized protein LOC130451336 isoform X1 [Diorhabda sublineata]|uniref:uncharacterized protein LOC130451336 isoform X1 n=1 Tax=Diorhabda sublineata TaxID=1163346 RepID=UPI0024E05353|nr:uncharacterized protein LOC130451336 isoform X1 [Diorhabda sublineata]
MTHYWWMHWFWITTWISLIMCKTSSSITHSNGTTLPPFNISQNLNYLNVTGGLTNPPTRSTPTVRAKSTPALKNTSYGKYNKTSQRKTEFLYVNTTTKYTKKGDRDKVKEKFKESVINISEKITDNQILINNSFNAINRNDNLTYFETDVNLNQSSIQTSESFGAEEVKEHISFSDSDLSAAGITGITLGCVVIVGILSGISYFIYRYRGFNRPQVLNDRCSNPDSSGYLDDASVRDNSEEMYSLDNDSFLNSLEAMTIQNYWTDTVKHTKL